MSANGAHRVASCVARTAPLLLLSLAACGSAARRPAPRPRPPPLVLAPREEVDTPRAVPLEVAPVDPKGEEALRAHLGEAAVPLTVGEAPVVTLSALEATAHGEAKGAEPDGAPRVVELREGQRAATPLPMSQGDCVTVIAHGGLGVMEVDAFLVSSPSGGATPTDFTILTQDTRTGPLAILGGQRGCFLAGAPAPPGVELWVQARKGAGPIVVGIYRVPRPG